MPENVSPHFKCNFSHWLGICYALWEPKLLVVPVSPAESHTLLRQFRIRGRGSV